MAKKKEEVVVEQVAASAPTFTKKKIVASQKYAKRVDILNVLLSDDKSYTLAEVEQILDNAFKGKYQIK